MFNNNVIQKDDNIYGFYGDILEYLKEEMRTCINDNNFNFISPDQADLLDELTKYNNYDGILKLSDNNGMGWTVEKVAKDEPQKPKYIQDFYSDAGAIMGQNLDTYTAELNGLIYIYNHEEGIKIEPANICELRKKAEKLVAACDFILDEE